MSNETSEIAVLVFGLQVCKVRLIKRPNLTYLRIIAGSAALEPAYVGRDDGWMRCA
jgi:hypothetical protein